jgi:hypothetical protein
MYQQMGHGFRGLKQAKGLPEILPCRSMSVNVVEIFHRSPSRVNDEHLLLA